MWHTTPHTVLRTRCIIQPVNVLLVTLPQYNTFTALPIPSLGTYVHSISVITHDSKGAPHTITGPAVTLLGAVPAGPGNGATGEGVGESVSVRVCVTVYVLPKLGGSPLPLPNSFTHYYYIPCAKGIFLENMVSMATWCKSSLQERLGNFTHIHI